MGIIKNYKEIELIRKATKISNSCIPLIEKSLHENIAEKELRRRIGGKIRSQHAALSFQTIVACGKRSAKIHAKPRATDKIIRGIGYVDFGACYRGYKSDVTVPFIKGKIGKRERKIVEATVKAYDIAIESVKVGMPCWKLFDRVNSFLRKNNFKMIHALGHGVGIKTHELPYIGRPLRRLTKKKRKRWEKLKKIKFQENMIFTIEPAVYVKGLGGCRMENTVLLRKKGPEILTNARLLVFK